MDKASWCPNCKLGLSTSSLPEIFLLLSLSYKDWQRPAKAKSILSDDSAPPTPQQVQGGAQTQIQVEAVQTVVFTPQTQPPGDEETAILSMVCKQRGPTPVQEGGVLSTLICFRARLLSSKALCYTNITEKNTYWGEAFCWALECIIYFRASNEPRGYDCQSPLQVRRLRPGECTFLDNMHVITPR